MTKLRSVFKAIISSAIVLILFTGCWRPDSEFSSVTLQLPTVGSQDASKKVCFGASVSAPDISDISSSPCRNTVSIKAGFAAEGGTLTMAIPKGTGRKFELYVYLVDSAGSCPAWDNNFEQSPARYLSVYRAGETYDVTLSKESETVAIAYRPPDANKNIVSSEGSLNQCLSSGSEKLRGVLMASGDIMEIKNSDSSYSILSKAYWESFFEHIASAIYESNDNIGLVSSTGSTNGGDILAPAYLHSYTKKPDSKEIFALDEAGSIYLVNNNGQALSSYSCPFLRCQVPPWVQSISAGFGNRLFALDHAGTIYSVEAGYLTPTGITVAPSVVQISFY